MNTNVYGIIYKITNIINNKIYIGQTIRTMQARFNSHIRYSKNKKTNMAIANAIRKYGEKNFICEILTTCNSKDELNEKELYYIKLFNSNNSDFGYNLVAYHNGTTIISQSTIEKHRILSSTPQNKERMRKLGSSKRNSKRPYAKSRYIGVNIQRKGYGAEILVNNKRIWLGTYELESDAAKAKDIAELKYFNDKAILNFPELKEKYLNNEIIINKKQRNKSGVKGISFNKKLNKWIFSLKGYKVKSFNSKEDAINYRNNILVTQDYCTDQT